ncbi:hypothetical protein BDN70DRAFT_899521 [Pholiota conissans]|uniref:Uncharacterized protein n=1 Tax=Pholiota conissans TaxID=109636 RepID=A0A9P5YQU6_9AGAR|nr:hypothetical protein BDN70DRAFT_899521 [Pholiota conissans]
MLGTGGPGLDCKARWRMLIGMALSSAVSLAASLEEKDLMNGWQSKPAQHRISKQPMLCLDHWQGAFPAIAVEISYSSGQDHPSLLYQMLHNCPILKFLLQSPGLS